MINSVETDNVVLVLQQKNPLYLFFRAQAVRNMAIRTVGMKARRCLCTRVKGKTEGTNTLKNVLLDDMRDIYEERAAEKYE